MEENTVSETSDLPSDEIVLSSGRTVRLPLIQTTTIHGVLVRIPYEYAQSKLPEALQPVWYTPTGAVMLVLGAEYPNERPYSLGPYDEFATLIPCTHKTDRVAPSLTSMLEMRSGGVWRLLDGYITEMPVTSEDSNEMGHRCWELPKQVMQITNEDRGGVRRTSVKADGKIGRAHV